MNIQTAKQIIFSMSTDDLEDFGKRILNVVEDRRKIELRQKQQTEFISKITSAIKEAKEHGFDVEIASEFFDPSLENSDSNRIILQDFEDFSIDVYQARERLFL